MFGPNQRAVGLAAYRPYGARVLKPSSVSKTAIPVMIMSQAQATWASSSEMLANMGPIDEPVIGSSFFFWLVVLFGVQVWSEGRR